jgi:hypothetical protein
VLQHEQQHLFCTCAFPQQQRNFNFIGRNFSDRLT